MGPLHVSVCVSLSVAFVYVCVCVCEWVRLLRLIKNKQWSHKVGCMRLPCNDNKRPANQVKATLHVTLFSNLLFHFAEHFLSTFSIFHSPFPGLPAATLPPPLVSGLLLMRRHNETIKCTKLGYSRSRAAQCHANAVSKVNTSWMQHRDKGGWKRKDRDTFPDGQHRIRGRGARAEGYDRHAEYNVTGRPKEKDLNCL